MASSFRLIAAILSLVSAIPASADDQRLIEHRSAATIFSGSSNRSMPSIPLPRKGDQARLIVEFALPPVSRTAVAGRSITAHSDLLARFRTDLAHLWKAASRMSSNPATIRREYSRVFSGAAVSIDDASVDALRRLPYVTRVSPDNEVRASVEPGVALIRADTVWSALSARGAGVTVAILDTGIDYGHLALGPGFGPDFKIIGGWDFANDDANPIDDNGHGTHVAGIVAANSSDLKGVAPEASLVAYKVLDENGSGYSSDIIAALERCADPNGDLDFSDRVDVANMSFGGAGTADDPLSQAVDNASALGVVVCVAAGNEGEWQSIGSPGSAAGAITVGAIDMHSDVAEFSSRGPAASTYALKPDVVAPGVDVRSALLNSGAWTIMLSGTSMAAPHVAGVAALLRELHPDWTAQQIKSAITTTAEPLQESVMAAGAGRVDAFRAATAETLVAPSSLNFGRVGPSSSSWSSKRTLTVTNVATSKRNYVVSASGGKTGLSVTISRSSFSLPPGESTEIEVAAAVDNTSLPVPQDGSLTNGGLVTIDDGHVKARVPFAIVRGVRVSVEYSGDESVLGMVSSPGSDTSFLQQTGPHSFEKLVGPGSCDVMLLALPRGELPLALIAFENLSLTDDRDLSASYGSALHTISFAAADERGVSLTSGVATHGFCIYTRIIVMPGEPQSGIVLGFWDPVPQLKTSTLGGRFTILGNETCIDKSSTRYYSAQYEPVRVVAGDVTRTAGGAALYAQRLEARLTPLPDSEITFVAGSDLFIEGQRAIRLGISAPVPQNAQNLRGTYYFDRASDARYQFIPSLRFWTSNGNPSRDIQSPGLRLTDRGVTCFDSATPPPTAWEAAANEPLTFGAGSVIPILTFTDDGEVTASIALRGQLDETVSTFERGLRLYDANDSQIADGYRDVKIADLNARSRLEFESFTHEILGHVGTTRSTSTLGATLVDPFPPTLTSMTLVQENGSPLLDRTRTGSTPRIRFSAIDVDREPASVKMLFRATGTEAWTNVPIRTTGFDYPTESLGHEPRGTLFEAELRDMTALPGMYDLRFELADDAGNTTVVNSSPAIAVIDQRVRPARP